MNNQFFFFNGAGPNGVLDKIAVDLEHAVFHKPRQHEMTVTLDCRRLILPCVATYRQLLLCHATIISGRFHARLPILTARTQSGRNIISEAIRYRTLDRQLWV